jgi:hypothetical protein
MNFPPEVERWRSAVAAYSYPQYVDKCLWVIQWESGGNPDAKGDFDPVRQIYAARGLFQIQSNVNFPNRPTPEWLDVALNNIQYACQVLGAGKGNFADWGENNLYQGKVFGALGNHPFPDPNALPPALTMTLEQRIERLEALVAGNGARAKDGTVLRGEAALKDQAVRGNSVMLGLSLGQDRDADIASALAGILSGTATWEAVLAALQQIIDKAKK